MHTRLERTCKCAVDEGPGFSLLEQEVTSTEGQGCEGVELQSGISVTAFSACARTYRVMGVCVCCG